MKKLTRLISMLLSAILLSSILSTIAYAELQSGLERFEGVSKSQKDQQAVAEIYEDLIYRTYEFDEDILLPELKHMNAYEDIKIKYVQGKRGMARGQSIYIGPDDMEYENRYSVKDGAKVKVYAKYKDYSFVEIMMNDRESEGTLGWIPSTYIVNKWNPAVSQSRTRQYGG